MSISQTVRGVTSAAMSQPSSWSAGGKVRQPSVKLGRHHHHARQVRVHLAPRGASLPDHVSYSKKPKRVLHVLVQLNSILIACISICISNKDCEYYSTVHERLYEVLTGMSTYCHVWYLINVQAAVGLIGIDGYALALRRIRLRACTAFPAVCERLQHFCLTRCLYM